MRERTELNSWKEIADRLDVSVRTAQLWEKQRGLPVRRLPGGNGRVFVRVDDLEAWMYGEDPLPHAASGPADVGSLTPFAVWVSGIVLSLVSWARLR